MAPVYIAIFPLMTLGFVVAGIVLVTLGLRGRPVFSAPHCAKCGYDLRAMQFMSADLGACPECGAGLSGPGGVSFGKWKRAGRMLGVGLVMLAMPVPTIFLMRMATRPSAARVVAMGGPQASAAMTNGQLITSATGTGMNAPWDWQELEARRSGGKLTNQEVDQAIAALIKALEARHAQGMPPQPLHWADRFVSGAMSGGAITAARATELYRAFYSVEPEFTMRRVIREGQPLLVDVRAQGPWSLNNETFVYALREVVADGKAKLTLEPRYERGATTRPDQFSGTGYVNFSIRVPQSLGVGEHEIEFASDMGAVARGSTFRGVDGKPGMAEKWPKPLARWGATTRRAVTVVAKGETIVSTTTEAALDPYTGCAVRVAEAVVRQASQGLELVIKWDASGSARTPIVCKVVARAGDETVKFGSFSFGTSGTGAQTSSYTSTARLKKLGAEVRSIDVTLVPDVGLAEDYPSVTRIWGGEHEIKGVPVERFDLGQ